MEREFSVMGRGVVRKDAVEKTKGEAKYVPDIWLPGMLYARFLRSPYAHARIKSIDISRAEQLPGVKCILTYKNVPKVHPLRKFEYLLDETVHHPGEEVAAVAALTLRIAEVALQLIEVEYEILLPITDVEPAIEPGAQLAHQEYGTNIYHGSELVKIPNLGKDGWLRLEMGNIEKGFAEADYILDGNYDTPIQYNCSPMPRGVICEWAGDKLTCWADTQLPLSLWRDLAHSLGIPESKVRIIANHTVGGYGAKTPEKTAHLTAIMAKRTGRPVKSIFSRAEDFIGTHRRVNYKTYHKIGVNKDGTLTAIYTKMFANYGSDTTVAGISEAHALIDACTLLYNWQNSKAEILGVLTNILGYGPMNGFGVPESTYGVERLIDEVAEKVNMDPVEFRLKNCIRYGHKALLYQQIFTGHMDWGIVGKDMDSLQELIWKCAEAAKWKEKWKGWRTPVATNGYKKRGIGIAIGIHSVAHHPSSAIVKMNQDGSANVLSGAVEIGQGYATAIAQVVAETLGIGYEDVNPILADTSATTAAIGNIATSGVYSAMSAAKLAAEEVKSKLFAFAAPRLNASTNDLIAKSGKIWVKGTDRSVSIADICSGNFQIMGAANNIPHEAVRDEKTGQTIDAFTAAVIIAEVEVDIETGKVDLVKVTSGNDCGQAINPVIIENQIDLDLVMGSGWVFTEDYIIDRRIGILVNPNLLDYKLMTFLDMPKNSDVRKVLVEKPSAWGPFGAKGMTETAITALPPAIANAIYNATGARIYNGSLSPSNVLKALNKDDRP